MGRKYPSQFASSLDGASRSTADDAGVLADYSDAVNEYRQVMGLNNAWEWGKSMAKGMAEQAIKNAPWVGGAYTMRESLPRSQ